MELSGGSTEGAMGVGYVLSTWPTLDVGALFTTFLVVAPCGLPEGGRESRERNEMTNCGNFAFRTPNRLRRYKEPARMPHIPGKIDLFQDDKKSCKNESCSKYFGCKNKVKELIW
uniref:Uncharacterized protein n=1 Tax=Rhizophora mucronata TaxID=61149 RepID=A0A2P2MW96_RHIMU